MDRWMDGSLMLCSSFYELKCNRFPPAQYAAGPGSYNPKPVERAAYSNQPPFWSSAKRFDRKSYRLFTGSEVCERTRQ